MSAELRFVISGDASPLKQTLNSAKYQTVAFANSIRSGIIGSIANQFAAIASLGVITKLTKDTIAFGGKMADLADTLKVNVEWLQRMRAAAIATGATEDDLFRTMMEMQRSRQAAALNPAGVQGLALGRLGFTAAEISGPGSLSAQQFVERIMAAFQGGATAQAENDVRAIGGRTASRLLLSFAQGIDENANVMSEATIDALDEIGDRFAVLRTQLMVELAPAILLVSSALSKLIGNYGQYNEVLSSVFGGIFSGASRAADIFRERFAGKEHGFGSAEEKATVGGAFRALLTGMKDGWKDAQSSVTSKVDEQDNEREAKEKAREARRRRNETGFDFATGDNEKQARLIRRTAIETDKLSKAGLFTVSGLLVRPRDVAIQEKQLATLQKIETNTRPTETDDNPFN